jgi:hypothetical protein
VVSRTRRLLVLALATAALGAVFAAPVEASSPQPQAFVARGSCPCC